ncbi:MAG: hypothetical protein IJC57_02825 [Clostridia bacterium]|nr:hypothetical protein [Clostridia bacterium]
MTIGEQIQNLRIQNGLTQERLAEMLEVYCNYCYPDGKFGKDETMEEMIESCVPFYVGEEFDTAEDARRYLEKLYPTLSRWKK